jgi:Outer membrane protein beta-barrel domain
MYFRLSKIKVLLLLICFTGFIESAEILADNSDIKSQSKVDEAMRRRKRPGSKSMFGDLEIFKKNLDIFIGPGYHSGSGVFLDDLALNLNAAQKGFSMSEVKVDASFFTLMLGAQYRYIPKFKDNGFASYLSYAAGLSFQRRGYEFSQTRILNTGNPAITDVFILKGKVRSSYINIPLSVHFGRRVFLEAGLSLDVLVSGKMEQTLDREKQVDESILTNSGSLSFGAALVGENKTNSIQPFVSPGFTYGAGMFFSENVGIRFMATYNNKFFVTGSNPENSNFSSTIFSVQLLGCVN